MRYLISFIPVFFLSYCIGQTLVLPGDFPDPSVAKIGDRYWATATTSNWAPAYPLLESKDLIHWELRDHVFDQLPAWADFYFWAPEITYDNGKVYVYYSAHKRGGNLCIAVASADSPSGPFTDHGPLMCQEAGSIDAWPMRDENGKLYLIWKEDGNSVKLPTPIWAMQMDENRTRLFGEKKELFKNDAAWESNLVEGVSMIQNGDYYYAFYAGAGCCGRACSYGVGIARSKKLLGPWEKFPANPVIAAGEDWKCPGHGTPILKEGRYYFLYHAYNSESNVYAGRQGLLSEFKFTDDGWIEFLKTQPKERPVQPQIVDEFDSDSLAGNWQWSVFQKVNYEVKAGQLRLDALPEKPGAFLGQMTFSAAYEAEVVVNARESSAEAGLALVGDEKNFISVSIKGNRIVVRRVENERETIIGERGVKAGKNLYLRAKVANGKDVIFSFSYDGRAFVDLMNKPVDGFFLPPWDRAVRVAITSHGQPNQKALFERFILRNK